MLGYRIDRRVGYEVHIAFQGYPPSPIVYYFYAQDTRGGDRYCRELQMGAFALAVAGWRWQFGDFAIATGRASVSLALGGEVKRIPTMRTDRIIG